MKAPRMLAGTRSNDQAEAEQFFLGGIGSSRFPAKSFRSCALGSLGWIEPELEIATHITTQCPVIVEIACSQWDMQPPVPELR